MHWTLISVAKLNILNSGRERLDLKCSTSGLARTNYWKHHTHQPEVGTVAPSQGTKDSQNSWQRRPGTLTLNYLHLKLMGHPVNAFCQKLKWLILYCSRWCLRWKDMVTPLIGSAVSHGNLEATSWSQDGCTVQRRACEVNWGLYIACMCGSTEHLLVQKRSNGRLNSAWTITALTGVNIHRSFGNVSI